MDVYQFWFSKRLNNELSLTLEHVVLCQYIGEISDKLPRIKRTMFLNSSIIKILEEMSILVIENFEKIGAQKV